MAERLRLASFACYTQGISFPHFSMDTTEIQKQCEAFLKSIGMPAFIIIGLQVDPENTQMVYSLKDMPVKGVVKGITHTLNDLISKI